MNRAESCYHFTSAQWPHVSGLSEYYTIREYPDYPVTDLLVFCLSGYRVGTEFWVMSQSLQHPRWCKYQAAKNLMAAFVKCLSFANIFANTLSYHDMFSNKRRGPGWAVINMFSPQDESHLVWLGSCQHPPRHAAHCSPSWWQLLGGTGCKIVWWCCLY